MSTDTDRLSEIVSEYTYDEEVIQLIDIDAWELDDLQEALSIIDNEVAERCNNDVGLALAMREE